MNERKFVDDLLEKAWERLIGVKEITFDKATFIRFAGSMPMQIKLKDWKKLNRIEYRSKYGKIIVKKEKQNVTNRKRKNDKKSA